MKLSEQETEVENADGDEEYHEPSCFEQTKTNCGRYTYLDGFEGF
jgi:hypothetical protein